MKILQVNSSARGYADGKGSYSSRLASELTAQLKAQNPGASVSVRDLHANPHPPMDEAALIALHTPAEQRTIIQAARVAMDDGLLAELMAADVIVLGVPMYNFGIPTQLKSWLDAIARAGVTFRYTEKGPVGLVTGKKVYVVVASGGIHRNQPSDQVTPYLSMILGFLGMTDVSFIYVEGLAMGPQMEERAVQAARSAILAEVGEAEAA